MEPNLNSIEQDDILKVIREIYKKNSLLESEVLNLKREVPGKLATVTGINAKTIATTTLLTVPMGKTLIVTAVVVRVTGFTVGSKSIQAIANLGGNSASFDDYVSGKTYTVSANGQYKIERRDDVLLPSYAAGANFSLKITTGSDATAETWAADVFGYYV